MQQIDRRVFKDGQLDTDSGSIFLGQNSWVNMRDFRTGSTDTQQGRVDYLQSIGSTILKVNNALPPTITTPPICLGHAPDFPYKRIIYAVWTPEGNNGWFCYDIPSDTVYTVLLDAQVTGGLGFDKYHPIHSAFVLNHCVYWTDNNQQPRRVNIDAGIKMNQPSYSTPFLPYTAPLDPSIISWIRRQPGMPPSFIKITQTVPPITTNFIAPEAFQFCYRYVYRDFETGTLSALSALSNFNSLTDTFNRIDVSIPLQEKIQQDVVQIDLVARYLISGVYFIINSWQTSVPADAAAIAAHNAGTTPLMYSFYNDKVGIALDSAYSIKPYDNVPLLAGTVEAAKNRGFMADVTLGYDSPQVTSLAVTPNNQTASNILTGRWFLFTFNSVCAGVSSGTQSYYLLDITNLPDPTTRGYYYAGSGAGIPPFPGSYAWTGLTFVGAGLFDVMNHFQPGCTNSILGFVNQSATTTITGGPIPPAVIGSTVFKTDASYQAAVTFYDYYGRKCGVVTNPGLKTYIADRTYNQLSYTVGIDWTLSNAAALAEIPPWAYYYSVDLSNCLRTRFFLQAQAQFIWYAAIDPSSGLTTFSTTTYAPTLAGVAVDISALDSFGQGYVFAKGDICKLYFPNPVGATTPKSEFRLSIIGQDNQFIICQLADVGTVGGTTPYNGVPSLFEIYTPYQAIPDEPYFEVGQLFPVTNPGLSTRAYSVIAGTFAGDVYIMNRNNTTLAFPSAGENYGAENMNPNDTFYLNWFTNAGRPNFVDTIGQVNQTASGAYSNTFILGSKINGLSTFDLFNTFDLSPDYGTIMKLVLTNKIQFTGSIMLAICSGGETASLYLNENVIITTTGETLITQSSSVVGYINNLKGSYGTLNPESVVEFRGNVYWYDALNGKYIQYSDSGLFPISNYKMTRYWKLFTQQYNSMTPAQIEALGSRPYVFSGIDPHHGELLVSVPRVLATPPMGYLVDYPGVPYPGDFWDGQAKSAVYKISANPNKWTGSYRMPAEQYAYMEDNLYAFYQGNIYLCNSTTSFGNIFGTEVFPDICFYSNAAPNSPKEYNNAVLQANMEPVFTHFATEFPTVQSSIPLQWTETEGIWYAPILRDRLTLKYAGDYNGAMFGGDKIRGTTMQTYMQFDASFGLVQIKFCNLTYNLSKGQVYA
jgi:hypothetical protein